MKSRTVVIAPCKGHSHNKGDVFLLFGTFSDKNYGDYVRGNGKGFLSVSNSAHLDGLSWFTITAIEYWRSLLGL